MTRLFAWMAARRGPIMLTCALAAAGYANSAGARLVEEKRWISAKVADAYGKEVTRDIMVTIFHDSDAPRPYPLVVLNHGRAGKASERAALGRAQYSVASRWLTRLGFMVAVPTRIGYGVTGGEDVEDTGPCRNKNYPPGYAASAAQTLTVLEHLRGWKEAAKDRAVIMGQSFGGTTAITIAAMNTPGVQATVNFAGGGGGNPTDHPGEPCAQPELKRLFAGYGKTARIPTLWIYSENDMYMGPTLPKEWFDAFRSAGGKGEYVLYPPLGKDGHGLFSRAPELWQPKVLEFLRSHGYPDLKLLPE